MGYSKVKSKIPTQNNKVRMISFSNQRMKHTEEILFQKNDLVKQLMDHVAATKDPVQKALLISTLVNNFKDDRIFPWLQIQLKDTSLETIHANLVEACATYSLSHCRTALPFFIDILSNGTYEASISTAQLMLHIMDNFKLDKATLENLEKQLNHHLNPSAQEEALKNELKNI